MTKKPPKYPLPPAVSLLHAHLEKIGKSQTAFCEEKGLDRIAVQRAVNGERQRYEINFILDIEAATDGNVPAPSWATAPRHQAVVEAAVARARESIAAPADATERAA